MARLRVAARGGGAPQHRVSRRHARLRRRERGRARRRHLGALRRAAGRGLVGAPTRRARDRRWRRTNGPEAHDVAAIIYTSGTTGPSKGVLVPWAELYWFANSHAGRRCSRPGDRVLQRPTPPSTCPGRSRCTTTAASTPDPGDPRVVQRDGVLERHPSVRRTRRRCDRPARCRSSCRCRPTRMTKPTTRSRTSSWDRSSPRSRSSRSASASSAWRPPSA